VQLRNVSAVMDRVFAEAAAPAAAAPERPATTSRTTEKIEA
jgi:hypothetical protein